MGADAFFRRIALSKTDNLWRSVVVGVACATGGLLTRLVLASFFTSTPGISTFYPWILLAALWGGWRGGSVALVACLVGGWVLTGAPGAAPITPTILALFTVVSVFAVLVAASLRRTIRRLDDSLAEQKLSDRRLIASEARFRLLTESAPVMLWMGREDGRCEHLNKAQRDFWGVEGDPEGFDWSSTLHPDDRDRVVQIATAAAERREGFQVEARYRRADGAWRLVTTDARTRFDAKDRFIGMIGVNIDITEAREAEAALRESEARFRSMADSAPAPVWVSDPEGGIDFVNRAMIEFYGGDSDGPIGQSWVNRIHPDDLPATEAIREDGRVRQVPFTFDARFRNGAGEWRWMSAATQPRFGEDGAFLGYVGIAYDVTEARKAQTALHEQTVRSRFLLELGDQLRELEDPNAIMLTAAQALGGRLGVARVGYGEVEPDEAHVVIGADWTSGAMRTATGRYLMDDFGPDLSRDLKARVRVAVPDVREDPRTAGAAGAFEAIATQAFLRVPLVRAGQLRAFLFLHSPEVRAWTEEEGDLAEQVAERTWAEVERARAEAALRESEARFRDIADTAPVLIWVTARDRTRSFVNQAYAAYCGHGYEEALSADWRELLHPDDQERVLQESMTGEASGQPFSLEARYLRADGGYRWLKSFSRPRIDARGQVIGFVGVAFDVTEARRAEEDLKRINELLEERVNEAMAEKAKAEADLMHAQRLEAVGRLTGGVAHDFNNLLTVIIGALDMVQRNPDDRARCQRLSEAALAAARRGERLTHQLLAFSRRQTLRPQPCDLNALIGESEPLLHRAVGEAVDFELKLREGGARVNVDPAQFEAALLNLVVNARDAVSDGGQVRIETTACTLAPDNSAELAAGEYVCVHVADNGEGMSDEVMLRVFEPFFTTKAVGKGTGLGLSQVYGFARQSGGGVTIDSEAGRGTTVNLYLPPLASDLSTRVDPLEGPGAEADLIAGHSVLLVEDDSAVAEVALDLLDSLGLDVQHAASGLEALHLLEQARFDLMLTDIVMPGGVNGIELARKVAERDPDMRILLTSGFAGEGVDEALSGAPWPFLRKPYSAAELSRRISEALDLTEPRG